MANGNDATSRRFQLLGKKLKQQETARTQQEQEGLNRRFAAIGGLGSGAAIKTAQQSEQASARRLSEGQEALGVAEASERQRQQEIREQREFQTGERLGSQEFAGTQAGLSRAFATGEREAGQRFAGGQAEKQRGFLTGERLGGQQFAGSQAAIGRRFASEEAGKQRGFQTSERLGSQEFAGGQAQEGRDLQREQLAQQESQFGRGLTEQKRAAQASEGLSQRQLEESASQFAQSRLDANNIADAQIKFQNADLAFREFFANLEFDLNETISFSNLDIAKKTAEQGDKGFLESIFPNFNISGAGGGGTAGEIFRKGVEFSSAGQVAKSLGAGGFTGVTSLGGGLGGGGLGGGLGFGGSLGGGSTNISNVDFSAIAGNPFTIGGTIGGLANKAKSFVKSKFNI